MGFPAEYFVHAVRQQRRDEAAQWRRNRVVRRERPARKPRRRLAWPSPARILAHRGRRPA